MSKLQKNIKQIVASKVLKDIDTIVKEENNKEIKEKFWSKIVIGLMIVSVIVIVLLINI